MLWMLVARLREFRRLGVTLTNIPDGARGVDLEGKAEASAQWKSHNYNHLMEQPTIFYAIVLSLAMMGMTRLSVADSPSAQGPLISRLS